MSYLEVVHPLRSTWLYNNWGYNLAADVIEKTSNMTWASFLSDRIFAPLQLTNTSTDLNPPFDNIAKGYLASPEGPPFLVESPLISGGTIKQGANGVKSTVKDLLTYYKAMISAVKAQANSGSSATPNLPFRDVQKLLSGHVSLDPDSAYNQSYGAEWAIAELPSPLGAIGTNGMFIPDMPVVGKGSKKQKVWYHNGNLVGFFSSVHILPDTDTAIIVLVNSLAKNDCADWIGQLLLETVLDNSEKNDYLDLAKRSAAAYESMWKELETDLGSPKPMNTNHRPLNKYTGSYYNEVCNWFFKVTLIGEQLYFSFQGLTNQTHRLKHHDADTFSWPLSEIESMRRGRWPDLDVPTYMLYFESDHAGHINSVRYSVVRLLRSSFAFTLAFRLRSNSTVFLWPFLPAQYNAVAPLLVFASISAPWSSISLTTAVLSFSAA